ncbi:MULTISPECIES: ROK family transcriptional regulator [Acidiphilium]|uniref:Transcriptional repressor n=2 Tax=Acidiphilium TaxID=522 RepID=F0J1A6_ACIMA|nr:MULTISPECIES: ROK family transcriptional regulator [Acidiphilium]BAJ79488.1 transcriptional repressor [Acidiphilium multivorum AIU301]GAN72458.1 transcriptional regulator/repressor [Acidiphilium multivorum AIU301]
MASRLGRRDDSAGEGARMTRARVNSALVRRINSARLFHMIRQNPGISQQKLSQISGIDPATISIIINNLESGGIVRRDTDAPTGRAGRPTTALSLDPRAGYLAGISVEPDAIRIVISTIDGTACADLAVPGSTAPEAAIAAARSGVTAALRSLRATRATLLAAGVAMPALVSTGGRIVFAPNIGWRDLDVAENLAQKLKVPVRVENDVKAAALAEHLFGASRDIADFVYVMGRSGIGGGLYLMGELYRGPHGLAGEIGHMKIVPGGRACGCGGQGCFEAYVSEKAILSDLAARGHGARDVASVRKACEAGDPVARAVLAEAGRHLGLALANLINIISPRRIVLGGSLAQLAPFLLPAAMETLEANALAAIYRDVEIVVSEMSGSAAAMGGIALALQQFLDDPPVRLDRARPTPSL